MRMTRLVWCGVATGLIGVGACSTPEASTEGRTTAAGGAPASAPAVTNAVVRERAVEMLEAFALSDAAILRANALEAFELAPTRGAKHIRRGLQDDNEGVRTVAAMVTGRVGLGQLEPELRTRADDPSPFVRAAVIYALVANGLEADPTPLATMLITDPSPRVRAHAAFILGELGDRSALPMLRQAANADIARADASAVRVMRLQFAEAMAKLGDETPLQGLRAALYPSRPEDLELTALAVQIIGGLGDRGSIAQLIYLSAARNEGRYMPPEVRLSVGQALGRMGRTEGAFLADEYRVHPMPAVREQAAHVYGWTLAESELGKLTPMLEDQAPQVRLGAAAAVLRVLDRDRP
jgi:HEAT repeat protein